MRPHIQLGAVIETRDVRGLLRDWVAALDGRCQPDKKVSPLMLLGFIAHAPDKKVSPLMLLGFIAHAPTTGLSIWTSDG